MTQDEAGATPEVIAERFHIEAEIHHSTMARVLSARDVSNGHRVAIKLPVDVREANLRRFALEAEILSQLRHPGIVRYIAHGGQEARAYIAMEWVDGEPLSTRLQRAALLPAQTISLARRLAETLAAVHSAGITHRDIKPTNILVSEALETKLIDFGIARRETADAALKAHATFSGGTWAYMSPEQMMGAAELGARADIFSLGCVLFECLTGRAAYPSERSQAVSAKLWKPVPRVRDFLSSAPAPLDALVARMMASDPKARPAHGAALLGDLAPLAG